MKINLFGYTLNVTLEKSDLPNRVDSLAKTYPAYNQNDLGTLVCRVKAHRKLTGASLKDSKSWVDTHFV